MDITISKELANDLLDLIEYYEIKLTGEDYPHSIEYDELKRIIERSEV